jgi:hypothetical protein
VLFVNNPKLYDFDIEYGYSSFVGDNDVMEVTFNSKKGVININGKEIIPTKYDYIVWEFNQPKKIKGRLIGRILSSDLEDVYDFNGNYLGTRSHKAEIEKLNKLKEQKRIVEERKIAENKKEAKQSIENNRSGLEGLFSKEDLRKHNEENKKKKNGIHTCKWCARKFKGVGFKIKGEKVTTGDDSGVVGLFYGLETIQPDFCSRKCGYSYLWDR